ncbi:hypothetical protein KUTeg_015410 [Tegillarca granosa]|uniref:Uncharacterized protein n=1 Tax=Tegillarca granosa TaxID=220873 RepID=A0ABQ9EQ10_TEGGR|nr:hypothetical protein KUTeg_015410 [Tegillarca granosa]
MVCGGFLCSKNALAALNVLYILVSFILIGVAAYSRVVALVTSLTLVGSIIACGVFLFIIALVGLIGAIKHHQVLLFFLSCCLKAPQATCCTGANIPGNNSNYKEEACPCKPCADALKLEIHYAFTITGGVGLFFSFTEIIGVWLALRYRNQKDPKANPSAFL